MWQTEETPPTGLSVDGFVLPVGWIVWMACYVGLHVFTMAT